VVNSYIGKDLTRPGSGTRNLPFFSFFVGLSFLPDESEPFEQRQQSSLSVESVGSRLDQVRQIFFLSSPSPRCSRCAPIFYQERRLKHSWGSKMDSMPSLFFFFWRGCDPPTLSRRSPKIPVIPVPFPPLKYSQGFKDLSPEGESSDPLCQRQVFSKLPNRCRAQRRISSPISEV